MKKTIFTMTALLFLPSVSFADDRDDLFLAIKNTLEKNTMMTGKYQISAQEDNTDIFSAESKVRGEYKKSGDFWMTEDISATFDFPDFGSGSVNISGFAEYSHFKKVLFMGITEMSGSFGDNAKLAGMFELAKIFAGNEFEIDVEKIKDFSPELTKTTDILENYPDFAMKLLRMAIDAGMLIVTETPEGYHITLNKDEKQWKPEVLAVILEMVGVPEAETDSLKKMDPESQKIFREFLADNIDQMNLSLYIGTENEMLTSVKTDFSLDFEHEVWDFSGEEISSRLIPFSGKFSSDVLFVSAIEPLQKIQMVRVSLTTLLKMVQDNLFSHSDFGSFDDEISEEYSFEEEQAVEKFGSNLSILNPGQDRTRKKSIIRY